jgi:hypothetical protein
MNPHRLALQILSFALWVSQPLWFLDVYDPDYHKWLPAPISGLVPFIAWGAGALVAAYTRPPTKPLLILNGGSFFLFCLWAAFVWWIGGLEF